MRHLIIHAAERTVEAVVVYASFLIVGVLTLPQLLAAYIPWAALGMAMGSIRVMWRSRDRFIGKGWIFGTVGISAAAGYIIGALVWDPGAEVTGQEVAAVCLAGLFSEDLWYLATRTLSRIHITGRDGRWGVELREVDDVAAPDDELPVAEDDTLTDVPPVARDGQRGGENT